MKENEELARRLLRGQNLSDSQVVNDNNKLHLVEVNKSSEFCLGVQP